MNIEEIYQAEQELERYNSIMSFKEILTQEEYEFCKEWDAEEAKNLAHIAWNNTYLNLNLYSEVDKEEFDLRREMGF
jgi:tRNA nucleotidyltransferase/poly(A) polymerase